MSLLNVSALQNVGASNPNIVLNVDGSVTLPIYTSATVPPSPSQSGTLWFDGTTLRVRDLANTSWGTVGNDTPATLAQAAAGTASNVYSSPLTTVPKDASGMTGAAILPSGSIAQRTAIANPVAGMTRFNTETGNFEFYTGGVWQAATAKVPGTGATYAEGASILPTGNTAERPTASSATGGIRYNSQTGILEYSNGANWISVGTGSGDFAVNITVSPPIPGISFATNVQRALEALELQAQDRIEFVVPTTAGVQASVSVPDPNSNDGTTLSLGLDSATTSQPGIVQLTNNVTGTSQTLAITQQAASVMNAQIQALTGGNVLAGTYNSNTGTVIETTTAGAAAGFVAGLQAPAASTPIDNYYLLVTISGNQGPPGAVIPGTGVQSGDWFIVQDDGSGAAWLTIDFENVSLTASQISLSPIAGLTATNVQQGIDQLKLRTDTTFTNVVSPTNGITVTNTVAAPFGKQASVRLNPATSVDIGGVFIAPNQGLNLTPAGGLSLAPPQPGGVVLGGVKTQPGSGILIDASGNISATGGGGSGSVTSVTVLGTNGLTASGNPITTSGTITLSLDIVTLPSLP